MNKPLEHFPHKEESILETFRKTEQQAMNLGKHMLHRKQYNGFLRVLGPEIGRAHV